MIKLVVRGRLREKMSLLTGLSLTMFQSRNLFSSHIAKHLMKSLETSLLEKYFVLLSPQKLLYHRFFQNEHEKIRGEFLSSHLSRFLNRVATWSTDTSLVVKFMTHINVPNTESCMGAFTWDWFDPFILNWFTMIAYPGKWKEETGIWKAILHSFKEQPEFIWSLCKKISSRWMNVLARDSIPISTLGSFMRSFEKMLELKNCSLRSCKRREQKQPALKYFKGSHVQFTPPFLRLGKTSTQLADRASHRLFCWLLYISRVNCCYSSLLHYPTQNEKPLQNLSAP